MSQTMLLPILILGPTAGGKSDFAVRLADRLAPAEIISADSMQIYRHLDAGTAKPTATQRDRVPHHMIDCVEPAERFTVADWLDQADALIHELLQRRVRPLIVGGTNLYIKALLEGLFSQHDNSPGKDDAYRASLAETETGKLHERLQTKDPQAAERIHPNDRKRIVRALEVLHLTGKPISMLQTQWSEQGPESRTQTADEPQQSPTSCLGGSVATGLSTYRHNPILIGLHYDAQTINPRINLRVKAMFHPDKVEPELAAEVCIGGESLPDETRRLLEQGILDREQQAAQALGYKQYIEHHDGRMSVDDAFERTKILTRRFAKQQRTWLRRFKDVHWIDAANTPRDAWIEQALTQLKK